MDYLFFGTPDFAAIILNKLIENGFVPRAVVCNPDRPVGRKMIITPPPTKLIANKFGVPVLQPENLKIENWESEIKKISPKDFDFFIVAAYAKIIPKKLIEKPRLGVIGVHPSLLPKYRGSSPIQTTIINGEEETGVTIYLLDEKMDHGPILSRQKGVFIDHKNYEDLMKELATTSGSLLVKTLPNFSDGKVKPMFQNEAEATYTKKFTTQDGFIEPKDLEWAENGDLKKAQEIERKIRALNPGPGTWTIKSGKRIKLLEAIIKSENLIVKKIQIEGEKPKITS